MCWFPSGHVLNIRADGSKLQTSPDGTTIEDKANGGRVQCTPNGMRSETFADTNLQEIHFPLGASYGARKEILRWPQIRQIITQPNCSDRYLGADGSTICLDPEGA